ncbi:hypothetical protein AVEN_43553-1 [Araneus ventricosus]|uniref:Uncharacterized protein n=1 Tax=Araneus ventricosus TaxID=182803 RepID=A0A4Y2EKK1_ARAVE|nr:hypothetical protein AVEN_43553-1 [Araneus ventricosus]
MQANLLSVISTKVNAIVQMVEKNRESLGKVEEKFDAIEDKVDTIQLNFGKLEQEIDRLKKLLNRESCQEYTENRSHNSCGP